MPDPTLQKLIFRIESEPPSRELDVEISVGPGNARPTRYKLRAPKASEKCATGTYWENDGSWCSVLRTAPAYTTSPDAKLPGEDAGYWIIRGPHKKRWHACYHPPGTGAGWDGEGCTEAMARRAA